MNCWANTITGGGPNTDCLERLIRTAGFVKTEMLRREPSATAIKAHRNFDALPKDNPSVKILGIINACSYEYYFPNRGRYAYLQIWTEGLPQHASRENVRVVVGEFGAISCHVEQVESGNGEAVKTFINIPTPPGLCAGMTSVQLFCEEAVSNRVEIDVCEGNEW